MPIASADISIWWYAFGYFACYAPYTALTKALSGGHLGPTGARLDGVSILPLSTVTSLLSMLIFISALRWWRFLTRRDFRWTFFSGLCTAVILLTTTLAYTFSGVSIVFIMLLMRGGVLVLAPLVDSLSSRRVHWSSWAGLSLSLGALLVAFAERGGYLITITCAVDVIAYLIAYFIRLRFMSRLAKSADPDATRRFFVQEQVVATPAALAALGLLALVGGDGPLGALRRGFVEVPFSGSAVWVVCIGLLSQGTGVFGGLILLGKQENTYCVPVNRCSSVLAGVVGSFVLAAAGAGEVPSAYELAGAGLIVGAILFLTLPRR